jgi:hypothetical protein
MADSLRAKLSPIYAHLFTDFFDSPEVVETRATCDTCAMCDHGQVAPVAMDYFRPDAKCCTYHPGLANYLVGAILADTGDELAEGRNRLRARIAARVGVTPQFISPPRKYTLVYTAARGSSSFGRAKSLQCPYFDADGRCTVWRYREAVCSTYFCKYTAGKPGWAFWNTLKGYLGHVERELASWSATIIDPSVTEPQIDRLMLTAEDVDDLPPNAFDYGAYWGKWVGREEEFYVACYERVRGLQKGEFAQNVDDSPHGRRFIAELEARYNALSETVALPKTLVRTTNMKKRAAGDQTVVTTYNPFDAFAMETELFDTLGLLDEKKTLDENLAILDKEHDVQLAPELLRYLFMHGVLTPPEPPEPAKGAAAAQVAPGAAKPAAKEPGVNREERRASKSKAKGKRGGRR